MSAQGRMTRGNPPPITRQGFVIAKQAIQTCNNDDTLNDDNEMQFILPGGDQVWYFEQRLIVVGLSTAADIKTSFNMTASGTYEYQRIGTGSVASGSTPSLVTTGNLSSGTASGRFILAHNGFFYTSVDPSTVKFQWCQATATVEDLSLDKGSLIDLRRVL